VRAETAGDVGVVGVVCDGRDVGGVVAADDASGGHYDGSRYGDFSSCRSRRLGGGGC